jgi:hypothetical protein
MFVLQLGFDLYQFQLATHLTFVDLHEHVCALDTDLEQLCYSLGNDRTNSLFHASRVFCGHS